MKTLFATAALAGLLVLGGCGGGADGAGTAQTAAAAKAAQTTSDDVQARPKQAADVLPGFPQGRISVPATGSQAPQSSAGTPMAAGDATDALVNGGFEVSARGWAASEGVLYTDNRARTGVGYAWLGGYNDGFDQVSQKIALPAAATSIKFQFWVRIATDEVQPGAYDGLLLSIHDPGGTNLASLHLYTNRDANTGYVQSPAFDLTAYAGRTVEIRFSAVTDESLVTSFLIDDATLMVTSPAGITIDAFSADYTITQVAGGFSVQKNGGAATTYPSGTRLNFRDKTVALDATGVPAQMYRLYQAAFARKPDGDGLGYQINAMESSGLPLAQVSQNFISSPEFNSRYGALDNAAFVTQLYRNVLGRAPDASGLSFHVQRLASGTGRRDVLIGFSESPENQSATSADIARGISYTPLDRPTTPVATAATSTTPTCVAPKVLRNGLCTVPQMVCAPDEVLVSGTCRPRYPNCVAPSMMVNGTCVAPNACATPKILVNGLCVIPPRECTPPQVLQNGSCVVPPPPPPTCTPEQELRNGVCVNPGYCYPLGDVTVTTGMVVEYHSSYYYCKGSGENCMQERPGSADFHRYWAAVDASACAARLPPLNSSTGSIRFDSIVIGARGKGQPDEEYHTTTDPSFYPVLVNEYKETVSLTVCYAKAIYSSNPVGFGTCTTVPNVKPGEKVKIPNVVTYPLGLFQVSLRRSELYSPLQTPISQGQFDARTKGFVPVYEPQQPPPSTGGCRPGAIAGSSNCSIGGGTGGSSSGSTGGSNGGSGSGTGGTSAQACFVPLRSSEYSYDKVAFRNACNRPAFFMYCGDLEFDTTKKCGMNSDYYTHWSNTAPGQTNYAYIKRGGQIRWGACFGTVSFGNSGDISASANGSYRCLKPQ